MKRGSRTGRGVGVAFGAKGAAACLAFALFPACSPDDPSREPTTDIRRSALTATPAFVQGNYAVPQTPAATVSVTLNAAQPTGDLNVAIVGWGNINIAQLTGVVDSRGNAYQLAVGPTVTGNRAQSIYYAKNIVAAPAGTVVTATFNAAAQWVDVRVLEYSGIDTISPLDVAVGATGTNNSSSTPAVTTTSARDLLVAGNNVATWTTAAGAGFTKRFITNPNGDIAEDRVVNAAGSYGATASLGSAGAWVMQMAAFRAAVLDPETQPPTAPAGLAASAISMSQINLAWTASTDNIGVTGYLIERCQGAGCSSFAQVGTAPGTTFNNTGLALATSYSYRVRATDAAGNLSAYSNIADGTTLADTQPPTAPSNLTATASGTQINLGWTASTDDVGVTGYSIERCQGAGCSDFASIGVASGTTFANSGLAVNAPYSYRVQAIDAAGNLGSFSNTASATTPAPDTEKPSTPASFTAVVVAGPQVNLAWMASTDNVAVTGYFMERCEGAGCHTWVQIGTPTGTTFSDAGVAAGTTYRYWVRATDAAGNLSNWSNIVTVVIPTPDTEPPTSPPTLTATVLSSSQINLEWTPATDNVGIAGYFVERCQGAACASFAQVASPAGTALGDAGLAAATAYSYRVRAADAAGNLGPYSSTASATTYPPPANPAFVQGNYAVPSTASATVPVAFNAAQAAGDLNVAIVGWTNNNVAQLTAVADSSGNTYQLAVGPTVIGNRAQFIYYAKNIVAASAGGNVVTATFSAAAQHPDVRILEYSGIDTASPLDVAVGGSGSTNNSTTPVLTTTNARDLLVAGNDVASWTLAAGTGFVSRFITNPNGDIAEDRFVTAAGSYNATAPLGSAGAWVMQMAAFKAASGGPPPPPDTTPPTVSIASPAAGATLTATVTVAVNASDTGSGVVSVRLLVDGAAVGQPDTAAPFSIALDTTAYVGGVHTLSATAVDQAGNAATAAPISVTFSNSTDPTVVGSWGASIPFPIVTVHKHLLPGGRVLMWDGQSFARATRIWNSTTGVFDGTPFPAINPFCSGHTQMADGRIFVAGGHRNLAHVGITSANLFDPITRQWTVLPEMANPRWYATATALSDGRMLVLSGEGLCAECFIATPEIYNPVTNSWTALTNAGAQFAFPYYPHVYVLPDGRVIVSSTTETPIVSQVMDLGTATWSPVGGPVVQGGASAMYLPGKIMKSGSSVNNELPLSTAQPTAYVLDMTQASPLWRQVGSMAFGRIYHSMTILPDGDVLVTGGGPSSAPTDVANAILPAELWSATTETWTTMASMHAPRLYHSSALLMPDARVLISGGGRFDDVTVSTDQFTGELFSPPYLFKGPRPVITSAPGTLQYGQAFTVQTPDAARVAKVSLVRFGSITHSFNTAQRYLSLSFTQASGQSLTVTAPANANLATPGNYMLFVVDTNGVPSVAAELRL